MMLFPVAAATDMTVGERAAYAGRMLLHGMVAVFTALAILWGALALFRLILKRADARKAAKPAPAPAAPAVPAEKAPDDGALVAAITAAVAAVLTSENGGVTPAFRVVSYRRVGR